MKQGVCFGNQWTIPSECDLKPFSKGGGIISWIRSVLEEPERQEGSSSRNRGDVGIRGGQVMKKVLKLLKNYQKVTVQGCGLWRRVVWLQKSCYGKRVQWISTITLSLGWYRTHQSCRAKFWTVSRSSSSLRKKRVLRWKSHSSWWDELGFL